MKPYSSISTRAKRQDQANQIAASSALNPMVLTNWTATSASNYANSASSSTTYSNIKGSRITAGTINANAIKSNSIPISKITNKKIDPIKPLAIIDTLYPLDHLIHYSEISYKVWKVINPDIRHLIFEIGGKVDGEATMKQLFLYSPEDTKAAKEWFTEYSALFGDQGEDDRALPAPLDGVPVYRAYCGIAIQQFEPTRHPRHHDQSLGYYINMDDLVAEWIWLIDNCQHRVWHSDYDWCFETEEDRALYLMRV